MSRDIRRAELRPCAICGKAPFGPLPLCWRVRIDRLAVDINAARQLAGLEMMLGGSAAIANAFAGDPVIAKAFDEEVDLFLCEACAVDGTLPVAALAERSPTANATDSRGDHAEQPA